jgi:thioredoxin-related protein|tara:strand:- start:2984 stop:3376 length:393 start_codon:yes stop_codon:yes gene_type:complete
MKYIDLKLLLLFIFFLVLAGKSKSQDFINVNNFNEKIAKDIVAVEFWADWNKSNEFSDLGSLKDATVYRVDIMHCTSLQNDYDVLSVPTIIIFESGKEKERFSANIMFQLEADKKKIQKSIDEIMLAKFN